MNQNSTVTLAGPKLTEVLKVESELEALWETLASASRDESADLFAGGSGVANVVAATHTDDGASAAFEVLGRVIGHNPCRAIILNADPDADPPELRVEVSLIGEPPPFGEHQARCEAIALTAKGFAADNVPTAVKALYTSDLPIVLWWPHPPFKRDDFTRLAADADRLIVDTARMGRDGLQALGGFIEHSRKTRTSVSDLNWSRLTPYRQLFAQFFDSAKCREQLKQIEKVTIEAQEEAGLLMAGWLFSRLGDDCPMSKVDLKIADGDGPALKSLTMKCAGGEFAIVHVELESVEVRAAVDGETVARTVRIDRAPLERLLGEEISYMGRDRAFDATMKWVTMAALVF